MNIYSIIGFILATGVLLGGLLLSSDNLRVFWDWPSVFIVVGGTIAASAISFQLNKIGILIKIFFRRMIKSHKNDLNAVILEIMSISESYRNGETLEKLAEKSHDHFLKEGLQMLSAGIVTDNHALRILSDRADNMFAIHMEEANKIKTLAKFPPAFGMMGTTIGMIVLLGNLGGEDAVKKMGPAMGVCLITTLYGVVMANLAIVPISENLVEGSKALNIKNRIVIEGINLILKKSNPIIVAEELNSFLAPSDRVDWRKQKSK